MKKCKCKYYNCDKLIENKSNNKNKLYYCNEHNCKIDDCNREIGSGMICDFHRCKYPDCYNVKIQKYCYIHTKMDENDKTINGTLKINNNFNVNNKCKKCDIKINNDSYLCNKCITNYYLIENCDNKNIIKYNKNLYVCKEHSNHFLCRRCKQHHLDTIECVISIDYII